MTIHPTNYQKRPIYWEALKAIKEKKLSLEDENQFKDLALQIWDAPSLSEANELCNDIILRLKNI